MENRMNSRLLSRTTLFLCAFSVLLVPFFVCSPLPLLDYANHLSRMYIIENLNASEHLSLYYDIQWGVLPNLAMDVIVQALATVAPVETATLLFTILTLFTIASGVIAANWALFGNKSLLPFLVFLFLFNKYFLLGFLNFLFSVGLAFWVFAAWVRFRDRSVALTLPLFSLCCVGLFFSHLYGLGVYGILVGGYELHRSLARWRAGTLKPVPEWAVTIGQFIVPAILFLFFSETSNRLDAIKYGEFMWRIKGLFHPFVNYSRPLDVFTGVALGALLLIGLRQKTLVIHPFMIIPVCVLAAVYFLLPNDLLSGHGAALRMIVPLSLTVLAATDWRIENKTWRRGLIVFASCLFIVRMGVITANWWAADKVYAEIDGLLANVEQGSSVYVAVARNKTPFPGNPPISHMGAMAAVRRDALVNGLFVFPSQQILRYRYPPYADTIDDGEGPYPNHFDVEDLGRDKVDEDVFAHADPRVFQYVLLLNANAFSATAADSLRPVASGGGHALYQVAPAPDAQDHMPDATR